MSSRMFQGVVLQMKESVSRMVGVIDSDGIVVACSELTCIGEHWSGAVAAVNAADNGFTWNVAFLNISYLKKTHIMPPVLEMRASSVAGSAKPTWLVAAFLTLSFAKRPLNITSIATIGAM